MTARFRRPEPGALALPSGPHPVHTPLLRGAPGQATSGSASAWGATGSTVFGPEAEVTTAEGHSKETKTKVVCGLCHPPFASLATP